MADWQEKIQAAKREGEQLKEKIRQKKEDLNDTDRTDPPPLPHPPVCNVLTLFSEANLSPW